MKNGLTGLKDWEFDANVASGFVEHARQHIPNYEQVINKCARYCALNLEKKSKIIDVGCATGHTLTKLHDLGFTDLHGVDNSRHMVDLAPKDIATYMVQDTFPTGRYDMILCNWTLHFIRNKFEYLHRMREGLNEGGSLIISEKISKEPELIKMYHDHKTGLGVSKEVIEQKQKQLENVMFIESMDWYQRTLQNMGFGVSIIDADWCFATFLCRKKNRAGA